MTLASLFHGHPSDFRPLRFSRIQPVKGKWHLKAQILFSLTNIKKPSSLPTKSPHICSSVCPFSCLFSYHLGMYFPRSLPELPIIAYISACPWVRSGVPASSNPPGPLLLTRCFTTRRRLHHSVVALCEACLTLIPSPPGAHAGTRCPKDQRCIFLAPSHYITRRIQSHI